MSSPGGHGGPAVRIRPSLISSRLMRGHRSACDKGTASVVLPAPGSPVTTISAGFGVLVLCMHDLCDCCVSSKSRRRRFVRLAPRRTTLHVQFALEDFVAAGC